jgi:hypothetical protein
VSHPKSVIKCVDGAGRTTSSQAHPWLRVAGCDRPAVGCDLDRTIPDGDGGPTRASNLKCLCRLHHLFKTFCAGPAGWTELQLPDGTVILPGHPLEWWLDLDNCA